MKRILIITVMVLGLLAGVASAEDKKDYQIGTYITAHSVTDGTITSTIRGDGTTVAGGVYENRVNIYTVKVADGVWKLETNRQAVDATMRSMGSTPAHIKSEKPNPLDFLKNGDRVLFRVEHHRKIGGTETDVFIPYADNPDKECKFIGTFISSAPVAPTAQKPTDNVKAMCDAHKLSPEQEKQFCNSPAPVATQAVAEAAPSTVTPAVDTPEARLANADLQSAAAISSMSCEQIKTTMLPNAKMIQDRLPKTWAAIQAHCPDVK